VRSALKVSACLALKHTIPCLISTAAAAAAAAAALAAVTTGCEVQTVRNMDVVGVAVDLSTLDRQNQLYSVSL